MDCGSCCDGLCCYQHVTAAHSCLCGAGIWTVVAFWESFGRREMALCLLPSSAGILKFVVYFPVSTELWERVSFEKPHVALSSPRRDTGMTQAVRDSFPLLVTSAQRIYPFFIRQFESLVERRGQWMLLFPERGCRSVACWVISTAHRASLGFSLNMMFLEWERKEVFFSLPQTPHPKSALLTLF